jgi:TolB-like protein/Tfp pilus assembly protein PilF
MSRLFLQLLGEFGLQDNSDSRIAISSKKARALFAYLATRPDYSASRIDLARVLWERHDDSQALTNLRQTLSVLNQKLAKSCPQWLLKGSGTIALNPQCFKFDIEQVELQATADQDSLEAIVNLFRGPFLQGLSFHENSLYEWLCQQRERFERLGIETRKKLLQQQLDQQHHQQAIDNAEQLILLDPVDEDVHCQLMRAYSASGQRHRVMRQYQKCCQFLEQHQLGKPQPSTDLLFQSLYNETVVQPLFESERMKPDEADVDSSANQIPAIAVLPFNDLMSKPESQALSIALTEETVNELRRFHGFKVISALSSLSLRNQNLDLAATSKILGARYLVCGSIRQSQMKIQVAVELVDASNGELIWAERYTRKLEDLFVLQAELARDIAGSIEPEAVGHSYLLSNRKSPTSLTAWELVLRGDRQLYKQLGTRRNSDEVQSLYRSAMQLDPDYAPAYSGLAYSLCLELKEGIAVDSLNVESQMLENAQQAVRLDDGNPWCQVILGRAQQQLREYDAAVIAYRKAVELCPSSSKAHFGLGFGLSTIGEYDESIESLDRAIELSPRDPLSWSCHTVKALTYIYSGEFEKAAASSALSSSYANSNHWAPAIHAPTLVHLGRYDEAQKVLEKVKNWKPDITIDTVERAFSTKNESDNLAIREGLSEAGLRK